MNRKMLFIEGVSNTGKTTLCKRLNADYGFYIVDEGARYLESHYECPREEIMAPPSTIDEERSNQDLLFWAERQRLNDAFSEARQGRDVVFDKTCLMIVASALAFERCDGLIGDPRNAWDGLMALIDEYREELDSLDPRFVLFSSPESIRASRNLTRQRKLQDAWTREDVTAWQTRSCRAILRALGIRYLELDSTGEDTVERVLEYYLD